MAAAGRVTGLRWLFWLIPLALLPVPLWLNPYQQYVLNTVLVYVPVGIGFNLVVGNLGLLAFSNVAYFGLGAYTSGILMASLGLPWWLTDHSGGDRRRHRRRRCQHPRAARRAAVLSRHHDARRSAS